MEPSSADLLTGLLREVSRSFYLTLRVLPRAVRPQIGLAYLLARATDTIADTDALPQEDRLAALAAVRDRICGRSTEPPPLEKLAGQQSSPAERRLLERFGEALALLERLNSSDRSRIQEVLAIITSGQMLDLERFGRADASTVVALANDAELEDYTYRVAGCVGEFWTRLCRAHLFPAAPLDDAFLLANGVRFGKGLQMVNILRDLPKDLRLGRCYLPKDRLGQIGLGPMDLLQPKTEARLRPLFLGYVREAEDHLQAGWAYTTYLPRGQLRVRLACAWPIMIGMDTLMKLRDGPILDARQRIKISRRKVRQIILRSVLMYPFPDRWGRLFPNSRPFVRNPLPDPASLAK